MNSSFLADAPKTPTLSTVGRGTTRTERVRPSPDETGSAFESNDSANARFPSAEPENPFEPSRQYDLYKPVSNGKNASHAHDRIEERTPLHRDNVAPLQRAVDSLGLSQGSYHLPLRGKDGTLLGYAQFKGVPNRKSPVLATVLAPHMTPSGENLETRAKQAGLGVTGDPRESGVFDTDKLEPRTPESLAWNGNAQRIGLGPIGPALIDKEFNDLKIPNSGSAMETCDAGPSNDKTAWYRAGAYEAARHLQWR